MRRKSSVAGVSLRPFPYPYRAALALCSDIDGCDRPTFEAVHRFLNDPEQGLGLPVADSLFPVGQEPGQLAFFLPEGHTPGPDAELILEALRSGLIDTLHSWGDFNNSPPDPGRLRALAESFTGRLAAEGLKVRVWVNHGDSLNYQNLPSRLQPNYQGDDPASPYYTADLIRKLGVKFAWCSELAPWPLSPRRLPVARFLARCSGNMGKNLLKLFLGRWRQRRPAASLTRLCQPRFLADGSQILAFTRFNSHPEGLWGRPNRHTLRYALHPMILEELLAQEGFLVVYTHLGRPRVSEGELFPEPDLKALQHLCHHYQAGRIWVAPTAQLLGFWLLRHYLLWFPEKREERLVIYLQAMDDPTTGWRLPQLEELAGLCFYTPWPEATCLRLASQDLPVRVYPPDHTGQWSVGLPPLPPPGLEALES
jgi:hypothetical protein|uniref:Uncharacterized protein n=1 Tax=Desulfobacca acetoxidans TaxID=60893 RepID=A0A7C5AMI3_9BACT